MWCGIQYSIREIIRKHKRRGEGTGDTPERGSSGPFGMDLVSSSSYCQFTVATLFMGAKSLSPSSPLRQPVGAAEAKYFGSRSSSCVSESEGDEREKQISCTVLAQCFCKLVSEGARAG